MRQEYIQKIVNALHKCDDIEMLQIIWCMLQKQKQQKQSLEKCV